MRKSFFIKLYFAILSRCNNNCLIWAFFYLLISVSIISIIKQWLAYNIFISYNVNIIKFKVHFSFFNLEFNIVIKNAGSFNLIMSGNYFAYKVK